MDARDFVVANVSKFSTFRTTIRGRTVGFSRYPNELCLAENDAAGTDLENIFQ